MAHSRTSSLLVDRGDLPSLAAALLQTDPSSLVLWHVRGHDEAAPRREAMVVRHADLFGARDLVVVDPWTPEPARADEPALWEALELMQAALTARRTGTARIVWPAQLGARTDQVADTVDRATAVADLIALSPPGAAPGTPGTPGAPGAGARARGDIAIDLPLVDLDDDQVVDIVDDAGAPPDLFWPCSHGAASPCGACGECERWRSAYATRGLPGPWTMTPVGAG